MIKLYRGSFHTYQNEVCLFSLSSEGPYQLLKKLFENNNKKLTISSNFLLSHKYYFTFPIESTLNNQIEAQVDAFLDQLELSFPQIIWTKIIKDDVQGNYVIEFIPISFFIKRNEADGILKDSLEEMGYSDIGSILTFKKSVEDLFLSVQENSSFGSYINWESQIYSSPESFEIADNDNEEPDDLLTRLKSLKEQVSQIEDTPTDFLEDVIEEDSSTVEELFILKDNQPSQQEQKKKKKKGTSSSVKKSKPKKQRKGTTRKKKKKSILIVVISIVVLVLSIFALVSCAHFYTLRTIDGDSMKPTLSNKDIVVVEKYPSEINRGDVIVFNVPQMSNKEFVKRVVGLPGDYIYASNGKLYVNDQELNESYASEDLKDFYLEDISGRHTVPEGSLFVLGDNRNHSTDSRNFGFVESVEVKGKVKNK